MCYVRMQFSCGHLVYRDLKSREGNEKRCRCNNIAGVKYYFSCIECDTERSKEWENWQEKHLREPLPDFVQDNTKQPIDYDSLITQFGSQPIDKSLLDRFKAVTGKELHHFLRRGLAFSHRNLEAILQRSENKEPFFIYAGRGPSSASIHLGHWMNFQMAQWLSDVFNVPLLVMLSDDEKYYRDNAKTRNSADDQARLARENIKDIMAAGCFSERTFFYSNIRSVGPEFEDNERKAIDLLSTPPVMAYFGLDPSSVSVGTLTFSGTLAAGAIASSFPTIFKGSAQAISDIPCLAVCALDEDPYFQFAGAITRRLQNASPALLYIKYVSSPEGLGCKMSASAASGVIFMTDTYEQIYEKIRHASDKGLQPTDERQTPKADPEHNVCFQYLSFILEDDEQLEKIRADFEAGVLSVDDMNKMCANEIDELAILFAARRSVLTDFTMDGYMLPVEVKGFPKAATGHPHLAAMKLIDPALQHNGPETFKRRQNERVAQRLIGIYNDSARRQRKLEKRAVLHIAAGKGEEGVVKDLLAAGANVNAHVRPLGTALGNACKFGHGNIVQILLDAGAEVNAEGQYYSAVYCAAQGGYARIVQTLMDAGADISTRGGQYRNPLHGASYAGHERMVRILIDAGAEIDTPGDEWLNPLVAALHNKHEKVVQILRNAGAKEPEEADDGIDHYIVK